MKSKKTSAVKKRRNSSVKVVPWVHLSEAITAYIGLCRQKDDMHYKICQCKENGADKFESAVRNKFAVMDDGSEVSTMAGKSILEDLHPLQKLFMKRKAVL